MKRFGFLAVAAAAALVAAGCGGGSKQTNSGTTTATAAGGNKPYIVLVTDIGQLNDRGFNQLAYQGLKRAQKDLGIRGDVYQSQ